jgi:protein-S-isoprenylcysteine O-methyltransferase Ste14
VRTFGRVGTPLDVRKAAVALAADDIYAKTRNPMYQALGLLLLALAVGLASDWTALLLVPWALVMHFGVVLREETYLEKKFGEEYRQYLRQVPRYGWPL